MNIIPSALGEVADMLVLWDDCPDIGLALPRATQLVTELQWGAGALDETEQCLILYLFFGEDTAEIYLPEVLPTAPEQEVAVWALLMRRDPEVLKIRYGASPLLTENEVTLLLPNREGERLADRLRSFSKRLKTQDSATGADASFQDLGARLQFIIEEVQHAPGES